MTDKYPKLSADDIGVWRQDKAESKAIGITWDELFGIIGYKLDYIQSIDTILELEFEYGEYIELNSTWQGFYEVVDAITKKMPWLGDDWFKKIEELSEKDEAVIVWRKGMVSSDGIIFFPAWDIKLTPSTKRQDFLESDLGRQASVLVENEPWCSWNIKPFEWNGVAWYVTVFFYNNKLMQISISASWLGFDEDWWQKITDDTEIKRKKFHDDFLKKGLGVSQFRYQWGAVYSCGMNHHREPSSIVIKYKEGLL